MESDGPPQVRNCSCVLKRMLLANLERGWRGLTKFPKVASSPLPKLTEKNAWVTAGEPWFRSHLRHTALRQHPHWGFKVVTDTALMQAWLATAALGGLNIIDPDVREDLASTTLAHLTLLDIALPPALLVIRLGVKTARNAAMPEVLAEAIRMRMADELPTWVWDQPNDHLAEGHRCFSEDVKDLLEDWPRVAEGDGPAPTTRKRPAGAAPPHAPTGYVAHHNVSTKKPGESK